MSIVVTGASGQYGRMVVEQLLARRVPAGEIVATARDVQKISDLEERGVRAARLDYDDVDGSVLSPGDVLLMVSSSELGNREVQHGNVIDAAKEAGVAQIVFTSVANVDSPGLIVAPEYRATEALVVASGLPWVFLRHGWYTENFGPAFDLAVSTGEVVASAASGRVSSIERAELAEAAAVVLTTEGHEGMSYTLVGQQAWTHADLAAAFEDVLGRDVSYVSLDPDTRGKQLLGAGLDEGIVGFILGVDQNIADGELGTTGDDLATLLGRAPRTMGQTVASWA